MVAPASGPSRSCQAAARWAPVEKPAKIPSSAARNRAAAIASASVTCRYPVTRLRSSKGKLGAGVAGPLELVPRVRERAARQDRRPGGLDQVGPQRRVALAEGAGDAGERPSRADEVDEHVDASPRLLPDLGARVPLVGLDVGRPHELVGAEGAALGHELLGPLLDPCQVGTRDLAGKGAGVLVDDDHLGPQRGHLPDPLERVSPRDHGDERVPQRPADDRQAGAGVAAGQLDDRLPGAEGAVGPRRADDLERDPIFLARPGVLRLELGQQAAPPSGRGDAVPQLDERRIADGVQDRKSQRGWRCGS